MKCTSKRCLYMEYLKNIPLLELCALIAEDKLKCDTCNKNINIDDIVKYIGKDDSNDKIHKNK